MQTDLNLLSRFEAGLNPRHLHHSTVPAQVLGYGEISTVFHITGNIDIAYKRMPMFSDVQTAVQYQRQYEDYCRFLSEAGLRLPEDGTAIIERESGPIVFYIAQCQLPRDRFAHRLIQHCDTQDAIELFRKVIPEINKVWTFNRSRRPALQLALDGQISNWALLAEDDDQRPYYVDTSTPLHRINGVEQLDPELFLQSAPSFLRWVIRWLFLQDVMDRYYDPHQVYIDLAANLYKEQRPDLVAPCIEVINQLRLADTAVLTVDEVSKYYKEDKLIWTIFLAFRRLDRWIKHHLFRQRYEFILPGKIKR